MLILAAIQKKIWLTYAAVIAVVCFSAFLSVNLFIEFTTPNYNFFGTKYDFIAFYTAASNVLDGMASGLYDSTQATVFQRQIIPHPIGATGYMPFLNPPFLAVLLSPLAIAGITTARLIWLVMTACMAVFVLLKFLQPMPGRQKFLGVLLLIMTLPMYQTLVQGQVTVLVLFGCCLTHLFLNQGKRTLSGAMLCLLWIFPHFGLMALAALLFKREWNMLKGWLLASLGLFIATLPFVGLGSYFDYARALTTVTQNHFINLNIPGQLTWRGNIDGSEGINGFYASLLGTSNTKLNNVLYVATAMLLVGFVVNIIWKFKNKYTRAQGAYLFIACVLTAMLISPHLYAQGLVFLYLLLPALFTIYKNNRLIVVALLALVCNIAFVDQNTRLHIFTLLMFVGVIYYARCALRIKKA